MNTIEFGSLSLFSDANLISYWKLENVNDSKSSNNLTNNGTTPFNAAKFNNGGDFGTGNTSKYFSIASALSIDGGAISCGGWIKINSEPSNTYYHIVGQSNNTSKTRYNLYYRDNGGAKTLELLRTRVGVVDTTVSASISALGTSAFHHIFFTYDTTNLRIYLDGVLVGTPTAASGNGSSATANIFTIGADAGPGAGNYSNLIIDDVPLFSRALTADEVALIYNGPASDAPFMHFSQ